MRGESKRRSGWIWLDARWGSHRKGIIDGPQEERWARSEIAAGNDQEPTWGK